MGYRVNKITVIMEVATEFDGNKTISFAYIPPLGDSFVAQAMAINDSQLLAAAKAEAATDIFVG